MSAPVRLQLSRRPGFRLQEHSLAVNGLPAVNVARPGKWGNPFRSTAYTAEVAVDLYRTAIMGAMPIGYAAGLVRAPVFFKLANAEVEKLASLPVARLAGRNLACWCRPGEPCHADVLLELANAAETEERT